MNTTKDMPETNEDHIALLEELIATMTASDYASLDTTREEGVHAMRFGIKLWREKAAEA